MLVYVRRRWLLRVTTLLQQRLPRFPWLHCATATIQGCRLLVLLQLLALLPLWPLLPMLPVLPVLSVPLLLLDGCPVHQSHSLMLVLVGLAKWHQTSHSKQH
jgi:hypothetical protein